MSDLVLNYKQISNYPQKTNALGTENLLLQSGLGAPYQSISAATLVATAINNGPAMGVGATPPANADGNQLFLGDLNFPPTAQILWDAYGVQGDGEVSWTGGQAASQGWSPNAGFNWATAPISPGNLQWFNLMWLDPAGSLHLPLGTLSVARDPSAPNEVATFRWVQNNTVQSFNARTGAVSLTTQDIYAALQLTSPIATQAYVAQSVFTAMTTSPLVAYWNGRTGNVYLTLSDITCVFFQPGQQPISQTPPLGSNDNSIATTQWVNQLINPPALPSPTPPTNPNPGQLWWDATDGNLYVYYDDGSSTQWVAAMATSGGAGALGNVPQDGNTYGYNGVTDLWQAVVPLAGGTMTGALGLTGVSTAPTAPAATNTTQIATCAFVHAVTGTRTAGVASLNGQTGEITLTQNDIIQALGYTPTNAAEVTPQQTPPPQQWSAGTVTTIGAGLQLTAGTLSASQAKPTITSQDITQALGYVPYNENNPNNYQTAAQTTQAQQWTAGAVNAIGPGLQTTGGVLSVAASGVTSLNGKTGQVKLTNQDITNALGFAPYHASNPAGYQNATQIAALLANFLPNTGGNLAGDLSLTNLQASGQITTAIIGSQTDNLRFGENNQSAEFTHQDQQIMAVTPEGDLTIHGANAIKTSGSTAWLVISDDRVKQNVQNYTKGLSEICHLRPISYQYNGTGGTQDDGRRNIGLSAQATRQLMPELVLEIPQNLIQDALPGQLATDLGPLTLALCNAVRELADRLAVLETTHAA